MPLPRSFLYVPANREKFLDKAIGLPADAFIFDLEDSVPVPEKNTARAGVKEYAPRIDGHRVWVRVNGLDTGLAEADLDAVIGVEGMAGIFLPKTRSEVLRWDAAIGEGAWNGGRLDVAMANAARRVLDEAAALKGRH